MRRQALRKVIRPLAAPGVFTGALAADVIVAIPALIILFLILQPRPRQQQPHHVFPKGPA